MLTATDFSLLIENRTPAMQDLISISSLAQLHILLKSVNVTTPFSLIEIDCHYVQCSFIKCLEADLWAFTKTVKFYFSHILLIRFIFPYFHVYFLFI